MDAKSFAQVTLRLLAVFLIFIGIVGLPGVIREVFTSSVPIDAKIDLRLFIASFAIPPVFGIGLWLASPTLGRWMATPSAAAEVTAPLDVIRIQSVAFVVLGTWLAVDSFSRLLVVAANSETDNPLLGKPIFWQEIVKLLLSLSLIVGAKSLSRLALRLREFGLEPGK